MKKLLPIAVAAPMFLIGAAHPDYRAGYYPAAGPAPVAALPPVEGPVTYRPCRPGRGDDRCIQLYERGVRANYARWLRDHGVTRERTEVAAVEHRRPAAVGGPEEAAASPRRRDHARADDHRCNSDGDRHHGGARGM